MMHWGASLLRPIIGDFNSNTTTRGKTTYMQDSKWTLTLCWKISVEQSFPLSSEWRFIGIFLLSVTPLKKNLHKGGSQAGIKLNMSTASKQNKTQQCGCLSEFVLQKWSYIRMNQNEKRRQDDSKYTGKHFVKFAIVLSPLLIRSGRIYRRCCSEMNGHLRYNLSNKRIS